jgi:mRNA-degrading endonuclease toxin of MazEF toxin-antitoxin module
MDQFAVLATEVNRVNSKARLAIACPITSRVKGYPFEVPLPPGSKISGVVLVRERLRVLLEL